MILIISSGIGHQVRDLNMDLKQIIQERSKIPDFVLPFHRTEMIVFERMIGVIE